jgi:peptidyl-prolyl cis-trans isomerase SurA
MARLLGKTCIIVLLTALPSFAAAEIIDSISAIVNGEVITTYDIDKEAAVIAKEPGKKSAPEADTAQIRADALNRLIDKKLIDLKIKELDIKVSDEEVRQAIEDVKKQNNLSQDALVSALAAQGLTYDQYRAQLREQMERLRLMSQEVRSKIQVSDAEVKEYYESNRKRFSDEMFQARHIFFTLDKKTPEADVKRIMATAMSVLQQARSGADFGELAKKYSDDTSTAKDGGELGTFKKGEMLHDIENALETMKPGEISDLVETPAGLHIIQLEKKFDTDTKTFADVKQDIEETLYKKKSDARFNQWASDLKKNASIDIRHFN